MGGEVSTDLKSSNGIEISQLVQVLLNFDWFRGCPPLGGGGVGGCGWGLVRGCPPHTCTHTHMHACAQTCTRIWHHREFPRIPPMGVAICMKLSCLPHARVCACACVCVHASVHVWGHPPITLHPHTPTPRPQSRREPKTPKFNKSWTDWDNLILFEDSLPLNIPELI